MATQSQELKKQLKAAFPGVKFSVRSHHYSSITVEYTDGPGKKAVEAIANQYQSVSYCEYSGEILSGGNTYVSVNRSLSPEMKAEFMSIMTAKGYTEANQHDHWYRQDWAILVMGDYCAIDPEATIARMEAAAAEAAAIAEDEANDVITAEAETVIEPVQIEITPFFYEAKFAVLNKNDTVQEYQDECELPEFGPESRSGRPVRNWRAEEIKVIEHWTMSNEQYDSYAQRLMEGFEFIAGKGGSGSHNESSLRDVQDWFDYTEAEQQVWRDGAYNRVVAISAPDRDVIVVDTQGYNYARYVGLIPNQRAIKGLLFENTITAIAPTAPLQLVPTDFNPRNNPTFSHEGEIVYVVKFGQTVAGIPTTWVCQGMSGKRYEVGSDVVCQYIPKAA